MHMTKLALAPLRYLDRMRYKGLSSIHTPGSAEKRGQARQATAPHPAGSTVKDNTVPRV